MILHRLRGFLAATLALVVSAGAVLAGGPSAVPLGSAPFDQAFGATVGGMLCRTSSGWAILAPGSSGQVLTMPSGGGCPSWSSVALMSGGNVSSTGSPTNGQLAQFVNSTTIQGLSAVPNSLLASVPAGTLKANVGGSSASPSDVTPSAVLDLITATQGSILYRGATTWAALGPGTAGQVLATNGSGANPAWQNPGGNGTVTSVALALPPVFSVSGSPVTSSGTLTGTLATQTANLVWSGPASGAAAAPTFRALVPADLPAAADGCVRISVGSTTTLTLKSYGCGTLTIGGVQNTIPSAGVTYTASGLAASTLYYVYATASGGAVNGLALSTTGHIAGTDGREYRNASGSADTTQRLVGMVYTNTAAAPFLDSATWRGVANYFNRANRLASTSGTPSTQSASSTFLLGNLIVLTWADEEVRSTSPGSAQCNTAGVTVTLVTQVDGSGAGGAWNWTSPSANAFNGHTVGYDGLLSEGAHTLALWGNSNGSAGLYLNSWLYVTTRI